MSCPCGSSAALERCCGPLLDGGNAATAEALMRSRYTAHVLSDEAYLLRSWHPRTRPSSIDLDPKQRWLGLKIRSVRDGAVDDETGEVSFVARYKIDGKGHRLEETSQFIRHRGAWVYLSGEVAI